MVASVVTRIVNRLRRRGYGVDRVAINRELANVRGPRWLAYGVGSAVVTPGFAIVAHDDGQAAGKPLHRRPGWRQLLVQARAGDKLEIDLHAVGAVWRAGGHDGLVRAIRKGVTLYIRDGRAVFTLKSNGNRDQFEKFCKAASLAAHHHRSRGTRAGMRKARNDGRRYSRWPPWGWKYVNGRLVPSTEEQEAVGLVADLHGRQGWTYARIVDALEAAGLPSRGNAWSAHAVGRLYRHAIREGMAQPKSGRPWRILRQRRAAICG